MTPDTEKDKGVQIIGGKPQPKPLEETVQIHGGRKAPDKVEIHSKNEPKND